MTLCAVRYDGDCVGRYRDVDVLSLLSKGNETSRAGARDVLPIGSLVLLLTALVAAGAPGAPPDVQRASSSRTS